MEELMLPPERKPKEELVFYSSGIAHADGFIPHTFVSKERPQTDYCYRHTFHDGLVVKCEFFRTRDDEAKNEAFQIYRVWYDRRGAPRLSGEFYGDGARVGKGQCLWYKYATYDEAGLLKTIYHLTPGYRLRLYEEFTYRPDNTPDGATEIRLFTRNGELSLEGKEIHSKVKKFSRQSFLRRTQHGLKPIYPGFEEAGK
jgi:hypothetical protein